ncbi:MAG TPA: phosphoenolpyruvate mutase [Candidatus Limnocylindria bacterium]
MTSTKAKALREILTSDRMGFLMEAHNGLSAKVAEEAGFAGIWGSGLSISASMGVRDNNEMSWTQVLDLLEFMSDAVKIPMLLDGDTGYGNFNNMRRLVQKLETREVAGVCIEDKLFPKTNSFIGESQPLADMDEFCGKIKAGKDAQHDDDFCIVARVEALIAGWGLDEALKRAEAYRRAGADAILIHSKLSRPDEILGFMKEWGGRGPVVIVPTTYYDTPSDVFRAAGVSVVIWANHLMRSALTAMQQTAQQLHEEESLLNVEDRLVTVKEVFRIQGASELEEAEKRYLPPKVETPRALILAAGRGKELGVLTEDRPKTMVEIAGKPLLERTVDTLRSIGIKEITVVRGYRKDAVQLPGLTYVDNDEHETTQEAFSLLKGLEGVNGSVLVAYGDVLFQKFIPMHLFDSDSDFCIAVDPKDVPADERDGYRDLVISDRPFDWSEFDRPTRLVRMNSAIAPEEAHGEWMGLLKLSAAGVTQLRDLCSSIPDAERLRTMRMSDVFDLLLANDRTVEVVYVRGHWLDVDDMHDILAASNFDGSGQYR